MSDPHRLVFHHTGDDRHGLKFIDRAMSFDPVFGHVKYDEIVFFHLMCFYQFPVFSILFSYYPLYILFFSSFLYLFFIFYLLIRKEWEIG